MTLASGTAYDTTVITFTGSSQTIDVSTSTLTKAGTYSLKVTGTVTGYTGSATSTFSLIITVDCSSTTITSPAIASYTYDINSGTLDTIATLGWTQTYTSACASLTYVLENQDGTASDTSVVNLVGTAIKVQTISSLKVGVYTL